MHLQRDKKHSSCPYFEKLFEACREILPDVLEPGRPRSSENERRMRGMVAHDVDRPVRGQELGDGCHLAAGDARVKVARHQNVDLRKFIIMGTVR